MMQMKNRRILGVCLAAGALAWNLNAHGAANRQARRAEPRRSIRVLLVTGGHPFETNAFLNIFQSMRGVRLRHATQPEAQQWWRPDKRDAWDVLVLYDLWQKVSSQAKEDFLSCLKEGKGLVVLHHALADYQDWPEFFAVAGGRYNLKPRKEKGKTIPASTYRHGVDVRVHIADPRRPVTRGMKDFTIHDEIYGKLELSPSVHPLLTTETPGSSPILAWVNQWQGRKTVCIQHGHDHFAYENPNYRRIVARAIRWVFRVNRSGGGR